MIMEFMEFMVYYTCEDPMFLIVGAIAFILGCILLGIFGGDDFEVDVNIGSIIASAILAIGIGSIATNVLMSMYIAPSSGMGMSDYFPLQTWQQFAIVSLIVTFVSWVILVTAAGTHHSWNRPTIVEYISVPIFCVGAICCTLVPLIWANI